MTSELDPIRNKIDSLDDKIHDLLMQRAELIVEILEEKRKHSLPIVQPAREAIMIRRLLERHKGPLPESAIVGIWRELVGAVSLMQTGISVLVCAGRGQENRWDMAKAYFGGTLPMTWSTNSLNAIAAVRDSKSLFAVMPWPEDDDDPAWWSFLAVQEGRNPIRVQVALPYGSQRDFAGLEDKALVISRSEYASSGYDHSFIALSLKDPVSRARIQDRFKAQGLKPLRLYTNRTVHMVEVEGFVAADDARLKAVETAFEDMAGRCDVLGGYPLPPTFKPFRRLAKKTRKSA